MTNTLQLNSVNSELYFALTAALRDRRRNVLKLMLEAIRLGMKDNAVYWAEQMERNNDAEVEVLAARQKAAFFP